MAYHIDPAYPAAQPPAPVLLDTHAFRRVLPVCSLTNTHAHTHVHTRTPRADVRQATQDAYAQATEAMKAAKDKVVPSGDTGSHTGTTHAPRAGEPQGNIEL